MIECKRLRKQKGVIQVDSTYHLYSNRVHVVQCKQQECMNPPWLVSTLQDAGGVLVWGDFLGTLWPH